jgi:hypothetical protein
MGTLLFEKFVNLASREKIVSDFTNDRTSSELRERLDALLKDVRLFVVHDDILISAECGDSRLPALKELVLGSRVLTQAENMPGKMLIQHHGFLAKPVTETLDLPFRTVFIEALGSSAVSVSANTVLLPESQSSQRLAHRRLGLLVHEVSPNSYLAFSLTEMSGIDFDRGTRLMVEAFELKGQEEPTSGAHSASWLLYQHLSSIFGVIRSEPIEMGAENVRVRIRAGRGAAREQVKINQVVHVRLKRPADAPGCPSGLAIEWSHRWEQRGHWRRVEGIGKDRAGVYNTKGFTWVVPCVKGPEELPLIKKIRLVTDDARDVA